MFFIIDKTVEETYNPLGYCLALVKGEMYGQVTPLYVLLGQNLVVHFPLGVGGGRFSIFLFHVTVEEMHNPLGYCHLLTKGEMCR